MERTPPDGATPGILLVEDDLLQAHLIRHLLETGIQARVTLAQDGDRGSALASGQHWDLVISDINLPGASGLEVTAAVKAYRPSTPVLITTAYTRENYREEALAAGADQVISKPLDRDHFLEVVETMLGRRAETRGDRQRTVLAVGSRPGDVEAGCGGTLLNHRGRGDRVVILVLFPDGAGTDPDEQLQTEGLPSKGSVRDALRAAARRVGALMVLGNLPRVPRASREELTHFLEGMVREFSPDTIYIPTPHTRSREHHDTYWATLGAARATANVYCYQAPASSVEFRPSLFVDIEEQLAAKQEALAAFPWMALPPEMVSATATYWARFTDLSRAEPLEVVRGSREGAGLRGLPGRRAS